MGRSQVEISSAVAKGLRMQFEDVWQRSIGKRDPKLDLCTLFTEKSDGRSETYHSWKSLPRFKKWRDGAAIPNQGFEGVAWSCTNDTYGLEVEVSRNDLKDNRAAPLLKVIQKLGSDAPTVYKRAFFQVLKGSVDVDGLDTIPTAPDGQALFATTRDGVNPRYGMASGNLLAKSGTGPGNVRDDYYAGLSQFMGFQDTAGRELFDSDVIDQGVVIIFAASKLQVFETALKQELGLLATSASAPSNLIVQKKVDLWPTSYMTGDGFVMILKGIAEKPIFFQPREEMIAYASDVNNSDRARKYGQLTFGASWRFGVGVTEPFGALKFA